MKVKSLLSKMSRRQIEDVCKEKDWRLPTLEEGKKYFNEIEHEEFWIEGYENDPDPETGADEMRPLFYSNGNAHTLNPSFMLNLVVIKKDKVCPSCGASCAK